MIRKTQARSWSTLLTAAAMTWPSAVATTAGCWPCRLATTSDIAKRGDCAVVVDEVSNLSAASRSSGTKSRTTHLLT